MWCLHIVCPQYAEDTLPPHFSKLPCNGVFRVCHEPRWAVNALCGWISHLSISAFPAVGVAYVVNDLQPFPIGLGCAEGVCLSVSTGWRGAVQSRKPFSKLPLLQAPSPFPLNLKFLRTQPNGSREASVYTSSGTNGLHDCVQEDKTQLFFLFNFHVVVVKFRFHQWICSAQLILSLTLRQKLWETRPLADGWCTQEGKILTQGKKRII